MNMRMVVLFALVFGLAGIPVWAVSEAIPCDPEPTDQVIAYGDVLSGGDCAINPIADIDFFNFTGLAGETVRLVAVSFRTSVFQSLCWEILDPMGDLVEGPRCSQSPLVFEQTLSKSGTYRIILTEELNDVTLPYALSLERLYPFQESASPLPYGSVVSDEINPVADIDSFVFPGTTGSMVRLIFTPFRTSVFQSICVEIYDPEGGQIVGEDGEEVCGEASIVLNQNLSKTGDYLVVITEGGHDSPLPYNLSLNCISGAECPPVIPCTLGVDLTYEDDTLKLHFDLGATQEVIPANWKVFLSFFNTPFPAWSINLSSPIDPPQSFDIDIPGFPSLGGVGALTTLVTATKGIVCSDWDTVDTGMIAAGAKQLSPEEIRAIINRNRLRAPNP